MIHFETDDFNRSELLVCQVWYGTVQCNMYREPANLTAPALSRGTTKRSAGKDVTVGHSIVQTSWG